MNEGHDVTLLLPKSYTRPQDRLLRGLVLCWLGWAFLSTASASDSLGLVSNHGFCPNGVYGGTRWVSSQRPGNLDFWGSYCGKGDNDVGRVESREFLAPASLEFYLAGYPGLPGRRMLLRNVRSGQETELQPQSTPGEEWRLNALPVPRDWIGKPVQLIAEDTATGPRGWLGFSLPSLPASSLTVPVVDTSAPQGNLCPNGVYGTTRWPAGSPPGMRTWGSYCKHGDADTGWVASQTFFAGSHLTIYVAGYPGNPGLRLAVENIQDGRQILLQIPSPPGEMWRLYHFRLPSEWKHRQIRVLAGDSASGPFGWVGFSEPIFADVRSEIFGAAKTTVLILVLGAILLIPSAAACVMAVLRGVEDELDLVTTGFLALGLTGYTAFWIYFSSRFLGMAFSYLGLLACCAFILYVSAAKDRRAKLWPLKPLITPAALVGLASVSVMALGLLHGGQTTALSLASGRFGPPVLAGDNEIPKVFADAVYMGHIPRPLMADWLSSDRPPLQTGNTLWTYAWIPGSRDLPYLALSVVLQCSFLAALWAFLRACSIDCKPLVIAFLSCFLSGFTLLNAYYTWPKLYPVAFLLLLAAYLLTDRHYRTCDRPHTGATLGALIAFAMLGHGGSFFAILGIGIYMLLLRHFPSRRFLVVMAVTAILLYLPWTLYQKVYDPPGDRLLKWHLAGVEQPPPQVGFFSLLISQYGKLKPDEFIQLKSSNFTNLWADLPQYLDNVGVLTANLATGSEGTRNLTASAIRRSMFLYWTPAIGFGILGPLALLLATLLGRRRQVEFLAASRMWLLNGLTLVFWCLLIYGPGATYPHHGTYLTEVLAFVGSSLAFWAIRPWLAILFGAVQILWTAIVFVWLTPTAQPPGVSSDFGPVNSVLAAACLVSLAAIFALLTVFVRHDEDPARSAAIAKSSLLT